MIANNVILFPQKNDSRYIMPQTIEEVIGNMSDIRDVHIQESLETVVPMLFDKLSLAGFDLDDENLELAKYGALVVESIRSFLCQSYSIDHPLQIIANNLFVVDSDGNLSLSENLKITISNIEDETKIEP